MTLREFYRVSTPRYIDYTNKIKSGERDLLVDFSNATEKLRTVRRAYRELDYNDINFIKLMASKYNYNRETCKTLKGLSNNRQFAEEIILLLVEQIVRLQYVLFYCN